MELSKKKLIDVPWKIRIGLFLFGLFAFSPVSTYIFTRLLNTSNWIEIFIILFYILYKKKLALKLYLSIGICFCAILIILLLCLGILSNNFNVYGIFSNSRNYILLLICYSVFKNNDKINLCHMLCLCMGSVFGWLIVARYQFNEFVLTQDGNGATYGGLIPLSLLIIVGIIFKRHALLLVALCMGGALVVFAAIRRQMISMAFSLLGASLIKKGIKPLIKGLVFLGILITIISFSWKPLSYKIQSISPDIYVRVFYKTENLFQVSKQFRNESDTTRFSLISQLTDPSVIFDDFLLPHGFVSKQVYTDIGTGRYIDCPMLEMYYTLSFGGAVLLSILYLWHVFYHICNYFKHDVKSSAVWSILGLNMYFLLFIDGSFISYVNFIPFTAYALVNIFSRREENYSYA